MLNPLPHLSNRKASLPILTPKTRHSYWPRPSNDGRTLSQALALGLGAMFNHSTRHQNVVWARNLDAQCITYTAFRDIARGEELCISYGSGRLWFEDAEVAEGSMIRGKR